MNLIIVGILTGILSGMGVGGGILLVPVLVLFFDTPQTIAQGVIIVTFLPTAIIASYTHLKQGNIQIPLAIHLAIGASIGAIIGSMLANNLHHQFLTVAFGIFLIIMGIYQFIHTFKSTIK